VCAIGGTNELGRHSDVITGSANTAFHNVRSAEHCTDVAQVLILPPELKR
jgi:hypothetical protein